MLNKDLMSKGGGNLDIGEYTHLVTVADLGENQYGYLLDKDTNSSLGSMNPSTVTDIYGEKEVAGLVVFASLTIIYAVDSAAFTDIYLGRSDIKKFFGILALGTTYWNDKLFSVSDIGKTIPIWLSTTPPPNRVAHQ